MPSYTTTQLVNTVKTKALVPTSQATFTNAQILTIADEEMQTGIVPLIMSVREEYFVKYKDITITSSSSYEIPTRAIGSKLRTITVVDTDNTNERKIPLFIADQVPQRNDPYGYSSGTVAYLQGNFVVLNPNPENSVGGILRLYYFNRRNTLVDVTAAARIDGIDTVNKQITLSNVPSTYSLTSKYDFIKATPGFENLEESVTPTGISGLIFTFDELPSGLQLGDYLALEGESPVVQLPVEFQPVLAQRVILRMLEAIGDVTGVQVARAKLDELEKNVMNLISPRVDGNPKKVLNPYGPLSGGGRWRNWWNG